MTRTEVNAAGAESRNFTGRRGLDDERATELAGVFRALADPTRVKLFSLIANSESGEKCACDLTDPVGLSQPTVSHHTKILVEAGLLARQQRGRWAYYSTVPGPLLSAVERLVTDE